MVARQKTLFTVCLGGTSLINGRLANGIDAVIQKSLEQAVDRPVRVINFGKGSQTSTGWGVPTLPLVVAQRPDIWLTEGYAINDCAMGISRAEHNANLDTMISTVRTGSPRTRICLQTMSPASAADTYRTNLATYYADEMSKAEQWGVDALNHYVNWPNPLPLALTQIDPTTGQPDGLHPIKSAVLQYTLPAILAYLVPLILTAA